MKIPPIKNIRFAITEIFVAGFVWMFTVAFIIAASKSLAGYDAFYNAEIADIMRNGQWVIDKFPWTTCSIWNINYFDKEWLFHIYLVPFISFFGKVQGIKLATIMASFFIAVAWGILLRSLDLKKHIFTALLFILFSTGYLFLGRIVLCRSILFSLFFLPLAITCTIQRVRILLALTVVLYTLSYAGAWQILPIVFIFDCMNFKLYDNFSLTFKKNISQMLIPWALLGFIIGFALSPYFPNNIEGIFIQTIMVLKAKWLGIDGGKIMQASELDPIKASRLVWHLPFFFILLYSLKNAWQFNSYKKNWRSPVSALGILSILYFILTIFSQRFIEYLVPIGSVFIFAFWSLYGDEYYNTFKKSKKFLIKPQYLIKILVILLFAIGSISTYMLYKNFNREELFYKKSALWLKNNIKDKEIIFSGGWNDSSVLFFHAPQFRYLVMLEPYFMYQYSPEKYFLWHKIATGRLENPSVLIKSEFNSSVVFVPHNRPALKHKLLQDPYAQLQFEGPNTGESIFTLSVPKSEIQKLKKIRSIFQKRLKNGRTGQH